jgi:hypothetical protein
MKLLITILLVLSSLCGKAQFEEQRPIGSVSFGFGGEGLLLSLSLDLRLIKVKDFFLSSRMGVGTHIFGSNYPHSLSGNYGKKNLFFELGMGRNIAYTRTIGILSPSVTRRDEWIYAIAGLKYQYQKGRLELRVYTNPMFDIGKLERNSDGESLIFGSKKVMMYMGVSIGGMF